MLFNNNIHNQYSAIGHSRFEFYFVLALIGFVLLIGIQRYSQLVSDVKVNQFYLIADRFSSGVSQSHVEWFLTTQTAIKVDRNELVYSSKGWPADLQSRGATYGRELSKIDRLTSNMACKALLFHFVPDITFASLDGVEGQVENKLHILLKSAHECRFQTQDKFGQKLWFDYDIQSGVITKGRSGT